MVVHVLLVELSLNSLQGRGRLHLPDGARGTLYRCFFAASKSMRNEINQDHFRFRRVAFHSQLKFNAGNIFTKATA